jgi:hypothetical protein
MATVLQKQQQLDRNNLKEVYEMVYGDNGINRYTHSELIERLGEMYDDSQLVDKHREMLSRLGVITGGN